MNKLGVIRTRFDSIFHKIENIIAKYHRTYLGLVCLFALLGYAFVLLFPVMIIVSASHIIEIIFAEEAIDVQLISIWTAVLLISTQLSYRVITTRPVPAVGFTMPEAKIPRVYELVEKLQSHFKRPTIHRIIITANYELDIVKAPQWMLPIWSKNTLIIGLPLMMCLSPKQFEHMVARRIGQFSKQQNPVTNWLYQLRGIWGQYTYTYDKQKSPESKLLKWFFMTYDSLYKSVSLYAARTDELYADTYAMEMYMHDDIREMITADAVCRWYLNKKFWPAIDKVASVKTDVALNPFRKLSTVIKGNLNAENISGLKRLAFKEVPGRGDPVPSLRSRLQNIGHETPEMFENKGENAAEYFLGASQNGAINLMDKLWFKNNKKKHAKRKIFKNGLMPALKRS